LSFGTGTLSSTLVVNRQKRLFRQRVGEFRTVVRGERGVARACTYRAE
jgi:hypothetical protein